jgi:uncharacterized membrane protein (DUF106 family)
MKFIKKFESINEGMVGKQSVEQAKKDMKKNDKDVETLKEIKNKLSPNENRLLKKIFKEIEETNRVPYCVYGSFLPDIKGSWSI